MSDKKVQASALVLANVPKQTIPVLEGFPALSARARDSAAPRNVPVLVLTLATRAQGDRQERACIRRHVWDIDPNVEKDRAVASEKP